MGLGNVARVALLGAACFAAVGSATSNQNANNQQPPPQYGNDPNGPQMAQQPQQNNSNAPPPQQMDASRALGLWRSTFGAVKIEADDSKGGLQMGAVHGVWIYQRKGQEVTGYFHGSLRGNVLQFQWQEPNNPPLVGEGYIAFDQSGRQYSGRWWTERRDRIGDWNGWRDGASQQMGQGELPPPPQEDGYQQPQPYQQQPRRYAPPPQQQPRRPQYPTYPAPQQPEPPQQPAPQQQPPNDPYY